MVSSVSPAAVCSKVGSAISNFSQALLNLVNKITNLVLRPFKWIFSFFSNDNKSAPIQTDTVATKLQSIEEGVEDQDIDGSFVHVGKGSPYQGPKTDSDVSGTSSMPPLKIKNTKAGLTRVEKAKRQFEKKKPYSLTGLAGLPPEQSGAVIFQALNLLQVSWKSVEENEKILLENFNSALQDGLESYQDYLKDYGPVGNDKLIEIIKDQNEDEEEGMIDIVGLQQCEGVEKNGPLYKGDLTKLVQAFATKANDSVGPLGAFVFVKENDRPKMYQMFASFNSFRRECDFYLFNPHESEGHPNMTWDKVLDVESLLKLLPEGDCSMIPFVQREQEPLSGDECKYDD